MDGYGLSLLEIKHLIERALLPDRCVCEVVSGVLTLTLVSEADSAHVITVTGIKVEGLNNSRAIAHLIGEARYMLVRRIKGDEPFVNKPLSSLRQAG
jgi:hypothetical protein